MSSCWLEVVKETQSFHLELICGAKSIVVLYRLLTVSV